MSERRKPHNGRDRSGHFRVKQVDLDDLQTDPEGVDFIRDDVRLGGAVADVGPKAGARGVLITELIERDREQRVPPEKAPSGGKKKTGQAKRKSPPPAAVGKRTGTKRTKGRRRPS